MLNRCAGCEADLVNEALVFSAAAGGILCPRCQQSRRDPARRPVSEGAWAALRSLDSEMDWRQPLEKQVRVEVRHLLGSYITYLRGRQPRLLPYLGG